MRCNHGTWLHTHRQALITAKTLAIGASRNCNFQNRPQHQVCAAKKGAEQEEKPGFLSDLVPFQSESDGDDRRREADSSSDTTVDTSPALREARTALERQQELTPSRPAQALFSYASNRKDLRKYDRENGKEEDAENANRESASERHPVPPLSADASRERESGGQAQLRDGEPFSWQQQPSSHDPQLQRAESPPSAKRQPLPFAEPQKATLSIASQDARDVQSAKSAVLPPFQSVLDLTSAATPLQRGGQPATSAASRAGRALEDGEGQLPDGTTYKRESGETKGADGYWYRWTKLSGISHSGQVEWEERWWESSDWAGMKEMGAEKSGCRADGCAWRETWREAIGYDDASGEPMVERTAHKWGKDIRGDEWEEKWGEHYWSKGKAHKWADKWGKDGADTWHERWGEEYAGKDACFKYTDKWAERQLAAGSVDQWGDKWEEDFSGGKGSKKGETWSVDESGNRYQRWWGELHHGNGWVQKYGNSSTGEQWDVSEQMDTYYDPIPHFDYRLALDHSPTLKAVPTLPRAGDSIGEGIDSL